MNKRLSLLVPLLLVLSACVVLLPGERYQVVGQARMQFEGQTLDKAFARVRLLMDRHEYRIRGVPLEKLDRAGALVEFNGPKDSHSIAILRLEADCISLEALLAENSNDFRAPRALFDDVVRQLDADANWQVRVDEICPKPRPAS